MKKHAKVINTFLLLTCGLLSQPVFCELSNGTLSELSKHLSDESFNVGGVGLTKADAIRQFAIFQEKADGASKAPDFDIVRHKPWPTLALSQSTITIEDDTEASSNPVAVPSDAEAHSATVPVGDALNTLTKGDWTRLAILGVLVVAGFRIRDWFIGVVVGAVLALLIHNIGAWSWTWCLEIGLAVPFVLPAFLMMAVKRIGTLMAFAFLVGLPTFFVSRLVFASNYIIAVADGFVLTVLVARAVVVGLKKTGKLEWLQHHIQTNQQFFKAVRQHPRAFQIIRKERKDLLKCIKENPDILELIERYPSTTHLLKNSEEITRILMLKQRHPKAVPALLTEHPELYETFSRHPKLFEVIDAHPELLKVIRINAPRVFDIVKINPSIFELLGRYLKLVENNLDVFHELPKLLKELERDRDSLERHVKAAEELAARHAHQHFEELFRSSAPSSSAASSPITITQR
jgi:hypothetical protein